MKHLSISYTIIESMQTSSEWLGLLAFGAVLVATCRLLDFLMLLRQHEELILRLMEIEEWVAQTSITALAVRIAGLVLQAWQHSRLALVGMVILLFAIHLVDSFSQGKYFLSAYLALCIIGTLGYAYFILTMATHEFDPVYVRIVSNIFAISCFAWIIWITFGYLYILFYIVIVLIPMIIASISVHGEKIAASLSGAALVVTLSTVTSAFLLQSRSRQQDIGTLEGLFEQVGSNIVLIMLNLLFDITTVLISINFLRFMKKKPKMFVLIAFADILVSAILALALRATVSFLTPSDDAGPARASFQWAAKVVTLDLPQTDPDWNITPLMLTTFIPVAAYSSLFLVVGLLVKPALMITGHIMERLTEESRIPFTQAGLTLVAVIVAIKAVCDWLRH